MIDWNDEARRKAISVGWPQTQVHREYDPAAAKERLRVNARELWPIRPMTQDESDWVGRSMGALMPPVYDPYRPRILDHRQAEQMPWIVEALLTLIIAFGAIAIIILAALAPRS